MTSNEMYQAQNLPEKSIQVVQQEYAEAIATAEGALVEIDYVKSSLELFKQSLIDRINTTLEQADLTAKYTKPQESSSSYQLPGVFSDTIGSYDINELRNDNAKLTTIKQDSENAKKQNDMYYKMVSGNMADLTNKLQKLSKNYSDLISYIHQLS